MKRVVRGAAVAIGGVMVSGAVAFAAAGHGADVSAVAQDTYASGQDRGAAVSEAASSQAQAPVVPTIAVDTPAAPTDNHGAAVSAVAKDTSTTGKAHGAAVSAVAKTNGASQSSGASDHGAAVATAAQDTSTSGQAKGEAVSTVAMGDHGNPTPPSH